MMKRTVTHILLAACMMFVFSLKGFTQQADSARKLPPVNTPRETSVDIKHIALDLQFNWQKKQAYGKAAITFSTTIASDKIKLDAAFLTIQSVTLEDGTSLKFDYDGGEGFDNFIIHLNKIYNTNEVLTIIADYHTNWINRSDPNAIWGSLGKGLRFLEPTSTTPIKRRQIWSSGEPQSNRYWFPCIETPDNLRTTELKATVEKKFTVISNGELIDVKENADDTRTFYYKADRPYPNYLTSLAVGVYTDVKQQYQNILLHTYAYPDEKTAAEATTVRLPEMVKYFSELTGIKYPYPHYAQVMVQDYPFPGLNGQHTASIISDNMIDSYTTHADFFYLWDGVEAASLASQWFGNLVSVKDWSDMWLNVGFSHYFDALFQEHKESIDEYLTWYLSYDLNTVTLGDWANGYRHPIVTKNYDDVNLFTSDNYARYRGSLVLRMLRSEMGDENFFKAIKKYIQANANKQVTTNDFQKAVEETTGKSYQWFFDQWIYKVGLPKFVVAKNYDAAKHQFTIILTQAQQWDSTEVYPQVKYFMGKMKVEIDNKIETIQIEPKETNIFQFSLPAEPKLVNVDFQSVWIKEMEFVKTTKEYLHQLMYDKDVLGKWRAAGELTKIYSQDTTTARTKEIIKNVFHKIATGNDYWRMRNFALGNLNKIYATENPSGVYQLDEVDTNMLLQLAKNKQAWIRTTAIAILGNTKDAKYADFYIKYLSDTSERVVNAAANALGKSKSPKAFDALMKLKDLPSWKSQSEISALNGLKELGDPRGVEIALKYLKDNTMPRWWLATSTWDYPVAAAETLVALGKADLGYPIIFDRFKKSLEEDDYNDIFANVFLIVTLADERGKEIFPMLKEKFKDDSNVMIAVNNFEQQLSDAVGKK